jgi:magnesium chelatase subunit I
MDDILPYPLFAIVGQPELKTALVLTLINPQIGGVLLIGPYGVGKTTAVRGLLDMMPTVEREAEDDEGNPRTVHERMRLIELPLNARLEDVVGGINERVALEQHRVLLEEGILAKAHRNLLYVDEINLLDASVVDAILDAAAQGRTMVRRGAMVRLFPSQFVLIGSMNPEEGTLRPQIMDRFGLRVWVAPLDDARQRLEVYRRARSFRADPVAFRAFYAEQTAALREEVTIAREILPHITVPPEVETLALNIIQQLSIPSHRAEIALLEAARARAAADFRSEVHVEDVRRMALLALRQRRSTSLDAYAEQVRQESELVNTVLDTTLPSGSDGHAAASPAPQDESAATGAAPARRRSGKRNKVRDLEQDDQP